MPRRGSDLVTPVGLGILALLTVVSAYLRIRGLTVLLCALLFLCLAAYLWARYALSRIDVEVCDTDSRAFPGEWMAIDARLCNRKFLALVWLTVRFPAGDAPCAAPLEADAGAAGITENFTWVMPWQSIGWTQRMRAARRGVCVIDTVELRSGDGFALADRRRRAALSAPFRLIVYPTLRPVDPSPLLKRLRELEPSRRGLYDDSTSLRTIRDYRDGDSLRDVNWRLLARQDKLLVNVRETLDMLRFCLILDLESFMHVEMVEKAGEPQPARLVHTDDMERMISLAASLIAAAHPRGVLCTLAVPAIGDGAAKLLIPETREAQVAAHLTALAEICYTGEETRFPVTEMLAERHRLGQLFLLSKAPSERTEALERALDGIPLFYVVQDGSTALPLGKIIEETELFRL